jgi:hypothetical protein
LGIVAEALVVTETATPEVAPDCPAERSTVNVMGDSTATALRQHNGDHGFDGSFHTVPEARRLSCSVPPARR